MEAFIYKITSPNTDKIYIGCTTKTLIERLNYHYYDKGKSGITSKEILDAGDATIELIEKIECNDKKELYQKEREYISSNKNICVNQRSIYKDIKECQAEWREKNREKIRAYDTELRKKKRELNPLPPKLTEEEIKQRKKEYQAKHKEEKKEYDKKRREELKDKLNEKIQCECGGCYIAHHKSTHIKTKKHLTYSKV
jgi:hypothetical protein